ncbi:hypothetical protein B0J14DRAFT_255361 [Halenospora varia]|nr:hypothetical protein B0J14DRAFT_255361 [Halenospora varia]
MSFIPLRPRLLSKRPLSQGTHGWLSKFHPLASPNGQNLIKGQFSLTDWIVIGCCIQALLVVLCPYRTIYPLAPTFALSLYKVFKAMLIGFGVIKNPHMKGVVMGRTTAIFPEADGSFNRNLGDTVGGQGICMVLLFSKCNHPLGMQYPPYKSLLAHGRTMFKDLEQNADEYGFLGYSSYHASDDTSKPNGLSIMYFRSLEYLHKYAHQSASHKEGFEWWAGMGEKVDWVSIGHEVYDVPAGGWENIYGNAKPYGFAATNHLVTDEKGERKWVCPIVDNKRMGAVQRMGRVKY